MWTRCLSFVVLFATCAQLCSSFTIGMQRCQLPSVRRHHEGLWKGNYMVEARNEKENSGPSEPEFWIDRLDTNYMREVEQELVQKYRLNGLSEEEAQRQVAEFLSDKEQAQKYVEMRMYTAAQSEDLGAGTILQLAGGFLFGFAVIAGPKFLHAFQAVSGDSGVPSV